jgi:hypothetical protein
MIYNIGLMRFLNGRDVKQTDRRYVDSNSPRFLRGIGLIMVGGLFDLVGWIENQPCVLQM